MKKYIIKSSSKNDKEKNQINPSLLDTSNKNLDKNKQLIEKQSNNQKNEKVECEEQLQNDSDSDNSVKYMPNITAYVYNDQWKQKYEWIIYEKRNDDTFKKMCCQICLSYQEYQRNQQQQKLIHVNEIIDNQFTKDSKRFRVSGLSEHQNTTSHKKASQHRIYIQNPVNIFEMNTRKQVTQDQILPHFLAQYFICKNKISFSNYPDIITLFEKINYKCSPHYQNSVSGKEIQSCIFQCIEKQFISQIKQKNLPISISLDTNSNRTNESILHKILRSKFQSLREVFIDM